MTFNEARILSRPGLHIRREGWEDKWFIVWRGVWWCLGAAYARPVLATDYTASDLLARDWTTMPAPLAACPIGGGSTGGDVTPPFGAPAGAPGGLEDEGGGLSLVPRPPAEAEPTPIIVLPVDDPGISVRFSGMTSDADSRIIVPPKMVRPHCTIKVPPAGRGQWSLAFTSGTYWNGFPWGIEPRHDDPWSWNLEIGRDGAGLFTVSLNSTTAPSSGGFMNGVGTSGYARGIAAPNGVSDGTHISGGTATIL